MSEWIKKKPKSWITKKKKHGGGPTDDPQMRREQEKPTPWIQKKKKTNPWIQKKKKPTTPWIQKKKKSEDRGPRSDPRKRIINPQHAQRKQLPQPTQSFADGGSPKKLGEGLKDRLKQLYDKKQKKKISPGRPGGKGDKPDKRWNKGDKFMTPVKRKKHNIGGRANLLEEMGRIDARKHPDAADRAEKRRVIGELNRGYNSGGQVLKGKKVGCQIK